MSKIQTIIACIISFLMGIGLIPCYEYVKTLDLDKFADVTFVESKPVVTTGKDTPKDGYGTWISPKGNMYVGQWSKGELKSGTLITEKSVYVGDLRNFAPHGYGTMYYNNGNSYRGNWKSGNKEGIGLKHNRDGSMYFGHWRAGLYNAPKNMNFKIGDQTYGIDVSFYQKYQQGSHLRWNELALISDANGELYAHEVKDKSYVQPVFFAFIKATQGIRRDTLYPKHVSEARKHQVIVGSYHFFTIGDDIDEQISNFIQNAKWKKGDLPPVLDLECEYYVKGDETPYIRALKKYGVARMREEALHWLESIEAHYKVTPIIYTTERWKKEFLNDRRFNRYKLWIARYYNVKPAEQTQWTYWQRTNDHFPHGYETTPRNGIDANQFNGSFQDFLNYRKALYQ